MRTIKEMTTMIGLGVAGNFAGHLEQAGEADSFSHVVVKETGAPKAIFPFYVPGKVDGDFNFLSTFPLSSDTIVFPEEGDNLQIEPEVGIICKVVYDGGKVRNLQPVYFGAYNDCSIRNPNARKISQKKNWGEKTKGISSKLFDIDEFEKNGIMDRYRIASYLCRDGEFTEYGVDSPVSGYSFYHGKLLNWIIEKMNHQQDEDPMQPILPLLKTANYPEFAVISIGATRYTEFGETHFLKTGDRSFVVVYDGELHTQEQMSTRIKSEDLDAEGISPLVQDII